LKTAEIKVEYLGHLGSDLDVVDAARVSFAKESEWDWFQIEHPEKFVPNTEEITRLGWQYNAHRDDYVRLNVSDKKLIHYLAKHNHWSPFAHCFLSFRIKAPIFCVKQLDKSRIGLAVNEVSRRYVADEPEFWFPEVWHAAPENKKQGSGGAHTEQMPEWSEQLPIPYDGHINTRHINPYTVTEDACTLFNQMIKDGYAPEEARMILPQNTMSEFIWSGSLFAFARVVNLRTDSHAQKAATQTVANMIAQIVKEKFPVSYEALCTTQ